ncbi:mitochondrial-processing peptidase-like protein subunit beta [Lophiotrema nucula]|uniref:mitochondrial processing peptidase n=1 Tax=Lophiotrema nucula TaxID=690887 RepID=A0A6A5Z6Q3_9PLEO|nr:mitochondrial-processing peptidase-like protein subunit beta [Lophiotrema nucula]
MASRRLALNLQQSLRSRAAINAVKARNQSPLMRGLATPVTHGTRTESTTLSNGFTIATEHSPWAQTSTVGVWIDAGSRAETDKTNGTAHFLEHLAFKGTQKRTQQQLELEIENMGGHLNAYTSRENTVYYAKSFNSDVPAAVDILSDILQHSKLEPSAIERERDVILREQEEVDKQLEEVVFDHLHATAFQGQPLGRTILGPKENIESIQRTDLENYIKTNYTADRMVLVGAGGVPHEQLVELAEKYFGSLPSEPPNYSATSIAAAQKAIPDFVGSEIRVRDDTMHTANIAIAVEGVSWKDDDYFTALVTQAIVGNWDRAMGNSPYLGSKLSTFVSQHGLANSFMSFSTSYSDTGLWGIYLVSSSPGRIDDLVHFTLREWSRLSLNVTSAEVERAKAQLKASILLSLDGTTAVAEDIGRQIITTGRRLNPEEVERVVGAITEKDVMDFAKRKLWDRDIAVSAVGQIEGLLDYNRIRNDMSRMLS